MKMWLSILSILISIVLSAQEKTIDKSYKTEISNTDIDSLDWSQMTPIDLGETRAYSLKLNTALEKKYYRWLEKRVDDVYPFVKTAVTEYYHVKDSARRIENKRERKKFINKRYNDLADAYEDKLKKLSRSRGQILVRLIERETKLTAYDMIKELRGGVNAFMWNAAGGAFDIDLKSRFDPSLTREDVFLEVIIRRGIATGKYPEIYITEERFEKLNPILKAFGRN
ncbi:DUF4294 domain-containing protein [Flavobacteriaceae bacterium Ap0902]|nr:DUF4294 domain-containing protein [Flavobacteriaceae bacterium Ap0902]